MAYELLKQEMYNNLNGINVKLSDYITQDNQVLNLRNYSFERPGSWITRSGYTGFATLSIGGGSYAPNSIFQYYFDSYTMHNSTLNFTLYTGVPGTTQYIYDSGATLYKLSPSLLPIAKELGPGSSGVGPLDFQVFNNILYYANGYAFQKYDGLSTSLKFSVPSVGQTAAASTLVPLLGYGATFSLSTSLTSAGFGSTLTPGTYVMRIGAVRGSKGDAFQTVFGMSGSVDFFNYIPTTEFADPIGITFAITVTATAFGAPLIIYGFTTPFTGSLFNSYGAGFSQNGGVWATYLQLPGENQAKLTGGLGFGFFQATLFFGGSNLIFNTFPVSIASQRADFYPSNVFFTMAPRYIETYNNMLFMSGFSGSPSTVWNSDVDDADTVQSDSFFEIRTSGNGEVITGMKTYQGSLYIFKPNSIHILTGTTPDDLSLQDANLEYGCLSNQAIATFDNKLWFMDSKGICEFNGNNVSIVSEKIAVYLNACDKTTARFYHLKKYNQVWCIVKNTTLNQYKNFVYDYLLDAWTIYDNFDITGGSNLFTNGRNEYELHFYGNNQSLIPKFNSFNSSLFTDDGFGITHLIKTKFHKRLGDSTQEMWRRFYLNNSVEGSTLGVTLNFYPDYGSSIYLTRTMGLTMFQSRIDYGISAKSLSVEILMKATTPVRINGYTIESRFLRPV